MSLELRAIAESMQLLDRFGIMDGGSWS